MLKVVLDTNVLIAGARSQRGAAFRLFQLLRESKYQAVVSAALALEYEEVLLRERENFGWKEDEVIQFIDWICTVASHYEIGIRLRPLLRDPDDDFLVELAFVAGVDYVVSHNVSDFAGSEALGVKVVAPAEFLALLKGQR